MRPSTNPLSIAARDAVAGRNAASAVLVVRPAAFGPNPQTAETNVLQGAGPRAPGVLERALDEHAGLVERLRAAGVEVRCVEDTPSPAKPDAVFPNNWVSFHAGGWAVLYPLLCPNRRAEVRPDVLPAVSPALRDPASPAASGVDLRTERVLDLRAEAGAGTVLEGTGSLVLDRARGLALACRSARTTPAGLALFAEATGYRVLAFEALDEAGRPYYHTNVLLGVGEAVALVALEALPSLVEREALREELAAGDRAVVELSRGQVREFAGNVLELRGPAGPLLALSTRALASLEAGQRRRLEQRVTLVPVPFDTIEQVGGGGVRCALAALYDEHARPTIRES